MNETQGVRYEMVSEPFLAIVLEGAQNLLGKHISYLLLYNKQRWLKTTAIIDVVQKYVTWAGLRGESSPSSMWRPLGWLNRALEGPFPRWLGHGHVACTPCGQDFLTAWELGARGGRGEAESPFMAKAQKSHGISPISMPVTRSASQSQSILQGRGLRRHPLMGGDSKRL